MILLPLEPRAIADAAGIGARMLEAESAAQSIRNQMRQLPDTHENLKMMIDAVAALVAASSAETSEVSELLDRASDAMEGVYVAGARA